MGPKADAYANIIEALRWRDRSMDRLVFGWVSRKHLSILSQDKTLTGTGPLIPRSEPS